MAWKKRNAYTLTHPQNCVCPFRYAPSHLHYWGQRQEYLTAKFVLWSVSSRWPPSLLAEVSSLLYTAEYSKQTASSHHTNHTLHKQPIQESKEWAQWMRQDSEFYPEPRSCMSFKGQGISVSHSAEWEFQLPEKLRGEGGSWADCDSSTIEVAEEESCLSATTALQCQRGHTMKNNKVIYMVLRHQDLRLLPAQ